MKIGFDAKRANANNTGLGNYSRFVLDALATYYPQLQLELYVPKLKRNQQYEALMAKHRGGMSSYLPKSKFWRGALSSLWRTFAIGEDIKSDKIEVFHGLSNEIPVGLKDSSVRSIVTIHDLIFVRYPKFYKPLDRLIYKLKFRYASLNADRVIAVSECTKRDIVSYFGADPTKIDVIYQGCDPSFALQYSSEQIAYVRKKYDLPARYILNVGTLEDRKNLMLCVKALEYLDPEISLVACGRATPYSDEVMAYAQQHGLTNRIKLLHKQEFSDLPVIYQGAEVFLYPSFFEGFGIPIIEALNCRIPVVAATGSCLEEAGGDAAIYIDSNDERALAHSVEQLIENKELRADLIARGVEYVKRFSAENIARDVYECYLKTLNQPK